MNARHITLITAALVAALAGCGGQANLEPAAAPTTTTTAAPTTPAPTPATPALTTTAPTTPVPKSVELCPANPPKNGELTDQGEQVGRIGRSSQSTADEAGGLRSCLAVTSASRTTRGTLVLTVLFVNSSEAPLDVEGGEDAVKVSVAYGAGGTTAERTFNEPVTGLQGVVPPGARRTGKYEFEVPRAERDLTVTVTTGAYSAAWTGTA